ncbi:phosphonate ABC transporter permease [Shouchella clausii]|uniref:phosphonate ABC transporter, permease protein PhnE n=1 Tax=Shouchella clausii TaxID=79880 RepID=UPI000BA60019|nr:phosphonate ABC transporter, permease protein PhnE [Shouchella clausii]MCM3311544.1 phosphonate ABC transporter, permease protein PhnE [Psychrobacillus sp. MER TA 17]PAE91493.1 phosphonate ABC transporter, permease protein PhnE [Shouchella clausii]GIN09109.1 phosphonate ABC transporter permease [Shouchella clausii]GIN18087.1 phosphonate ABC transporter permease [Shouchella clausii]
MSQQANMPVNKPPRTKLYMTLLLLFALIGASAWYIDANPLIILSKWQNVFELVFKMFPPDMTFFVNATQAMLDTIRMALIGTTIGGIISIPILFLCAHNIVNTPWIYQPARIVLNMLRTVPDLLLAAIFAAILGFNTLAGVVALSIFSIGIIAKLSFEAVENIDQGPLESMTSVGANKIQWIVFGVVPQVLPQFTSYVLYTFEINVRAAAILGLVGAGGIGLLYKQAIGFYNFDQVLALILYTFLVVLLIDFISLKIRERLI